MTRRDYPPLPRGIWVLGIVSLLMDLSSETIHSLLPMFLVVTLHSSMATVGLLEGISEATSLVLKVFAGAFSDASGRRKPLILLGYGLAAASKPLFALAQTIEVIFAARVSDRIGKGIRGAPRDALMADVTPPEQRGRAFGLRQSLLLHAICCGPSCRGMLSTERQL